MKTVNVHWSPALRLGLAAAVCGLLISLLPAVIDLENNLGLSWMFGIRGPRPAPPEVVIIGIDDESSLNLNLPAGSAPWPRSLHTTLLGKLQNWGARVVVFDVFFRNKQDQQVDREFASALSEAGNVILFASLYQKRIQIPQPRGKAVTVLMDQLLPPLPQIANSAVSYAPFPLPKVPERVNQTWLFKSDSGDIPTLPVLAFHQYAEPAFKSLHRELLNRLARVDSELRIEPESLNSPNLGIAVRRLRQMIQNHPELLFALNAHLLNPEISRFCEILKALYLGPDNHYIDFYGPSQTITTVPYHVVLHADDHDVVQTTGVDFKDKAVFIGRSEPYQPDLKDDFHTVFSEDTGSDLSGVEIMATVFGNLLEGRSIRPVERIYRLGLVALWGFSIGVSFYLAPGFSAIGLAVFLSLFYLTVTAIWFGKTGVWMPLVTPLLLQMPLTLLVALMLRFRISHKENLQIQQTASYFLPVEVVSSLTTWKPGDLVNAGRMVEGICLVSDAESFTTFAENVDPSELQSELNRYYDFLFQPIQNQGGRVLDIVGDAMLAIWEYNGTPLETTQRACHSAIHIQNRIALKGGHRGQLSKLPTRIGLHAGSLIVGNVGAGDHFEFRAVGDMINTTSRIEGLNKYLGTRILVSEKIADHVGDLVTRRTGKFRLKGKDDHLEIFELRCRYEDCDQSFFELREIFMEGLYQYEAAHWLRARAIFKSILDGFGKDGPSEFYWKLCDQYIRNGPPKDWDGIYTLKVK